MRLLFQKYTNNCQWKSSVNTSSNLLAQRTKTEQYGIRYKSLMQKMTNPGHSGIATVKWEPFMKSVWPQTKRTIYLNSHIKNCSEIPKKTLFKKEKNNSKTITTPSSPLSIFKNYPISFNSLTPPNPKRKRKPKKNHSISKKTSKVKSTNKSSLEKSLMKSQSRPSQNWYKLTTLITKLTTKPAKDTTRSSKKWS